MTASSYSIEARVVVRGRAAGLALVSSEPLSFWGGYDAKTGEILDRGHPLSGQIAAGKILAIPFTKGSSTTTQILLEAIRAGTAPAAIVLGEADPILALGAIVARELYGSSVPIVVFRDAPFRTGEIVKVRASERGADVGRSQPHAR
jgi:predicted aconitase with swiveling domain